MNVLGTATLTQIRFNHVITPSVVSGSIIMATAAEIVTYIVVNFVVLVIGAAILSGLAKNMIKGAKRTGFGTAFGVMFVWFLIQILLDLTGVGLILGLFMIIIYWILFALLIMGFYKCSFGRGPLRVAHLNTLVGFVA